MTSPWNPRADALSGARVLVVEDEVDTRELLGEILRAHGAAVAFAGDGREALGIHDEFAPNVVVSDLALPLLDGWQLVHELRRRGLTVPALALSANASLDDAARALHAGFDVHVAKPIHCDDFVEAVRSVLDHPRADVPRRPAHWG